LAHGLSRVTVRATVAGLLGGGALVSGDLEGVGDPGPGKWVTTFANAGRAYIEVAGSYVDTARARQPASHRSALEHRWHRARRVRSAASARALTGTGYEMACPRRRADP
jgi:hypothetical protein